MLPEIHLSLLLGGAHLDRKKMCLFLLPQEAPVGMCKFCPCTRYGILCLIFSNEGCYKATKAESLMSKSLKGWEGLWYCQYLLLGLEPVRGRWKVGDSASARLSLTKLPSGWMGPCSSVTWVCLCAACCHHPGLQSLGPETDTGIGGHKGASGLH